MNIFALSGLLTGVSCASIALLVFLKSRSNPIGRLWSLYCLCVTIWGFGVFAIAQAGDPGSAIFFWRITHIGVVFIPSVFYHFVQIFLGLKRRVNLKITYVISLIFLILNFTPLMISGASKVFDQFYYLVPGHFYILFFTFFVAVIFLSHLDLWNFIRKTSDESKRMQAKWFFIATGIAFSGGTTCFLPVFGINIYPYGNFAVPFYPLIMSYAILKHQLMDIKVVIEKTLAYSFFFIMTSIFYFLMVFVVYNLVANNFTTEQGYFINRGLYSIPPLLGGVFAFGVGFFVYIKNRRSLVGITFSLLCLSIFIWLISCAIVYSTANIGTAIIFAKIACIAVACTGVQSYHFFVSFLERKKEMIWVKFTYICTFLLLIIFVRTNLLLDGVRHYFWGFYSKAGPFYWIYLIFFYLVWGRGLLLLLKHHLVKRNDPIARNQAKYILTAFFVGILATIDYLPKYGIELYPLGFIFILLFVIIMAYAIFKHQLLDVRIVVRKTIFYSVLIIIISALYVLSIFLIYKIMLSGSANTDNYFFKGLLLVFIIALLLKPLEFFLHRIIDKKFFKGSILQIAEQKAFLETELERRERLKSVGILAAGMAHEIKNPITAIQTFAEYLPKKYDDPHFRESFSRLISTETKRVSEIVRDLLLFARPSEPCPEVCDVRAIMKSVLDLLVVQFASHKIQVDFDDQGSSPCFVDPSQTKQAFLNIIMNAIDAMKPKGSGRLTISFKESDKTCEITIEDSGVGISPEKIQHLFDPFYTDKEGGTGLGLAITHSIIEKNKGKIKLESESGKGAIFRIMLPLVDFKK